MSFVSFWKVISILLTGFFGVLGLLKDYRDKETGKVTQWGMIALSGILVSAAFGTIAQISESSHDEKDRAQAAAQTLTVVRQTQAAVTGIQRLLNPISAPKITMSWQIGCANQLFSELCATEKNNQRLNGTIIPLASFHEFHNVFALPLRISVFKYPDEAEKYITRDSFNAEEVGDLDYDVIASAMTSSRNPEMIPVKVYRPQPDRGLELYLPAQSPQSAHSSGRLVSLRDLLGTTVVISDWTKDSYSLDFDALEIENGNSEKVLLSGSTCSKRLSMKFSYLVCKFPASMSEQNSYGMFLADQ